MFSLCAEISTPVVEKKVLSPAEEAKEEEAEKARILDEFGINHSLRKNYDYSLAINLQFSFSSYGFILQSMILNDNIREQHFFLLLMLHEHLSLI